MRPFALSLLLASSALAQNAPPPAFEVASVKLNPQFHQYDRATWSRTFDTSPGTLTFRNVNLTMMLAWAYHLQWPQIVAATSMDDNRYDVLAKAGRPATDDEMRPMLQTLLTERFKLAAHRETRQLQVLALVVPKGGHKMVESKSEGPARNRRDPDRGLVIEGALLSEFTGEMSRETEAPIVDMTGLKGRFDFSFNVQKYVEAVRASVRADPQHIPSETELRLLVMQSAIAGELGLKLEPRKAPVEVLVVDHVEKSPSEN